MGLESLFVSFCGGRWNMALVCGKQSYSICHLRLSSDQYVIVILLNDCGINFLPEQLANGIVGSESLYETINEKD